MKNRLVKISLLLIALLMLFCFASCGESETPSAPVEKVKITFVLNRGSFVDSSFSGEMQVDKGSTATLPKAQRNGYDFGGWYLDSRFTQKCTSAYKFEADTTLYAYFAEPGTLPPEDDGGNGGDTSGKFTVEFNTSRAGDGITVPTQYVAKGGKVTDPGYTPTKKGVVFYGWCVDADKNKKWDFNTSTVSGNIVLWAVFTVESSGGGDSTDTCEHNFEVIEYVAPTCQAGGRLVQKCSLCRKVERYTPNNMDELKKLEHLELVETVEPTCAVDGYTTKYCPNGCGMTLTTKLPATGAHEYERTGWYPIVQPTKYVAGTLGNACVKCGGAIQTRESPMNAEDSDLYDEKVNVSFTYTGGSYVNERFVNVAKLGSALATSIFNGTKANLSIDGNPNTFWNADTYADGANYAGDSIQYTLSRKFDIGAFNFTLPNYVAWELGEGCYVSYDLEYWDYTTESWVYIDEVSDKKATAAGISCQLMITLDTPINTDKVRLNVTHAGRYNPAVIYETEIFAKTEDTERVPMSIASLANASISGKYNDWVSGAGALTDNSTVTYWTTDRRYNAVPWAILEFPEERYIACVQVAIGAVQNRAFKLEGYTNGEWVKIGECVNPASGTLNETAISNVDGICVHNVDVEGTYSKIRFTLTMEPEYWTSYVYYITPYTIVENAAGEFPYGGCGHNNPSKGEVVAPTCDAAGYTVMNCTCGAKIKTNATDAIGHDFGKYEIETAATATSLGTKVAVCRHEGCVATSTISYEESYDAPVITPYLHNAPAAWAQTLDDGNYLATYEWSNEHFAKYGVRASIMMSISFADALVSTWKEHFEKGVFDLGSHSYNHGNDYASVASASVLLHEVIDAQYWFRSNYKGQALLAFAAPLGTTTLSVAEYLTGPMAANRNGGDTGIFYNTLDQLVSREVWGDMNSYISKSDQTEGEYVFAKKGDKDAYLLKLDPVGKITGYELLSSYKNAGVNLVFDEAQMTFVDKGYDAGTYSYDESTYKYTFCETGSYTYDGTSFTFVNDNSGEYRLLKATKGSYEKGVETLVSVGGITVECLHEIGISGSIYSSYSSTISKLEHMTRFGIWGPSYNDLIKYIKVYQNAKVEVVERTEDKITISVTDNLDDFMYNHPVTVKVDIPDSWTSVTAMQNGKEIPLVSMSEYSKTINMQKVSCAIDDGFLYVDVVPDGGNVVITMGDKDASVNDYKDRVTVSFEAGEGRLESEEYEAKVVVGEALESLPTPERYGYKFLGWFTDADCQNAVDVNATYSENTTLYAGWEELPKCTDGSYNHKWGDWLPTASGEQRTCKNCGATESREAE